MAGSVISCINISIVDDNIPGEQDKSFIVTISATDPDVILRNDKQTVTITDDDGSLHTFD